MIFAPANATKWWKAQDSDHSLVFN